LGNDYQEETLMRKYLIAVMAIIMAFSAFTACSSGKSEVEATAAQKKASQEVVTDMVAVKNIALAPDDPSYIAYFFEVFNDAGTLLTVATGAKSTSSALAAATTGCASVSGGVITYKDCSYGGIVVNGTITYSGTSYKIALVLKVQNTYDLTINGNLTISDTLISGNYTYDIKYSTTGTQYEYKLDISYNNVTLESGCPVGGSMDMNAKVTQLTKVQSYSVTSKYGPVCGDVSLWM
jgi:hypothetical protein